MSKKSSQRKTANTHLNIRLLGLIVILAVALWAILSYWPFGQSISMSTQTYETKYEDISLEIDTYESKDFQGTVVYVKTDNNELNQKIRNMADRYFESCRSSSFNASSGSRRCNVGSRIDLVTPEYLQLSFIATDHSNTTYQIEQGLLLDRQSTYKLTMGNLFNSKSAYLKRLSGISRSALGERFRGYYKINSGVEQKVAKTTSPRQGNFDNFIINSDEDLILIFNDISSSPQRVKLPIGRLYPMINDHAKKTLFSKLHAKKLEEARRAAQEAKRRAAQAEAARRRTRQLVAPNRANIDCSRMKCIALTYDDGPTGYTSTILDILKSRRAVATFFVLGSRANLHASVLRRAVNEQNEVANHTWSHPNMTDLSNSAISAQISGTDKAILKTAGVLPKLIRPPYGAYDSRVVRVAERPLALWTIDPQDWLHRHSGYVYHRVVSSAHPGGVVVMHDTLPSTLHATPRIIDELQRQGYVLVTMSELFGITGDNLYDFSRQVLRGR